MIVNILSRDALYPERLRRSLLLSGADAPELNICHCESDIAQEYPTVADISRSGGIVPGTVRADAYLTDRTEFKNNGIASICKYSSVSELKHFFNSLKIEEKAAGAGRSYCRTLLFTSVSGGSGASTLAAAAALAGAPASFYLNLEQVNGFDFFEAGDGPDLGDALFASLSYRGNIPEKILSLAAADSRGVCFFRNPADGRDREGICKASVTALIDAVRKSGSFRLLCADLPFGYGEVFRTAAEAADGIVLVEDGRSETSPKKAGVLDFCRELGKELYEIVNRSDKNMQVNEKTIYVRDYGKCDPYELLGDCVPYLAYIAGTADIIK